MLNQPQGEKQLGLPGLECFGLKDYARLLMRRKWLIVISTFSAGIIAAVAGHFIPNVYRATTLILVDPRIVPENYVPPTVSSNMLDRLATLKQQVLSTTRLTKVMTEENLFAELRGLKSKDELVEMIRGNIHIDVGPQTEHGPGSFSISFESTNPQHAASVTNRLASLFISENVKAREREAQDTADFIDHELEKSEKELHVKEQTIAQLKTRYAAELPESKAFHEQSLNLLLLNVRGEQDAINRVQAQKVFYQSQLLGTPQVTDLDRDRAASGLAALQVQVIDAQSRLDKLQRRYGPNYPEVIKAAAEAKDLQRRIEAAKGESENEPASKPPSKPYNPVIESQIASADDEIQTHLKRIADTRKEIEYHQEKLERIPMLEQQLAAVNREYENAIIEYKILKDRKFSADMARNLETAQEGDRFRALDTAHVPQKPNRPNRKLIDAAGLAAGLIMGLLWTLGREMFDPSLKVTDEIRAMGAPVLAEIPILQAPVEQQRARLNHVIGLAGSVSSAFLFCVLAMIFR
jgi:succinoglycan biosynthesis transport protein ExoP